MDPKMIMEKLNQREDWTGENDTYAKKCPGCGLEMWTANEDPTCPGCGVSLVTESKYDPDQLAKGIKIEKEHTDDPKVAEKIAKDHLDEIPDYYTRLEKMEKGAKKDESVAIRAAMILAGHKPRGRG